MAKIAISDLPEITQVIPNFTKGVFPEDLSVLFHDLAPRVFRHGDSEVVIFRNKDLLEVAANPVVGAVPAEKSLALAGYTDSTHSHALQRLLRNLIFAANPPAHGSRRLVIARPMMPVRVSNLVSLAKEIVNTLFEEALEIGQVDFVTQVSGRLTARFWGALFDMTKEEVESLGEIVHAMEPLIYTEPSVEQRAAVENATDHYLDLVSHAIERALRRGGSQPLKSIAEAFDAIEGTSRPDTVGVMIAANAFEGLHTAAVACSNVVYRLLLCKEALTAARGDPNLVAKALAEGMRISPPFTITQRYALADLEFADVVIPSGTPIIMLWAAGNRDPNLYDNPNCYDLFRRQRSETTFGGGIRICPGRYVARMLAHITLERVLSPGVLVELTDPHPSWVAGANVRHLSDLPVSIRGDTL